MTREVIKYRCLSRKFLFMARIASKAHVQIYCVDNMQSFSAEPGGVYRVILSLDAPNKFEKSIP
jgi:hypothetical protein